MSLLHGTWTHLLSAEVKQGGSWYGESYEVLTVTARRRCDCAGWGRLLWWRCYFIVSLTDETVRKNKSLFTFVCLMYQQYNDTFHELRMQLENQVVQIP